MSELGEKFLAALERANPSPGEVELLATIADLAVALFEIRELPEERLDEAPEIARQALLADSP